MILKCVDDKFAYLTKGKEYKTINNEVDKEGFFTVINDCGIRHEYSTQRFVEINNDDIILNNIQKSYWYVSVTIKNLDGHKDTYDTVIDSDNDLFPLRKVEESYNNQYGKCEINYKSISKISKEDYEWKYNKMSKFRKDEE